MGNRSSIDNRYIRYAYCEDEEMITYLGEYNLTSEGTRITITEKNGVFTIGEEK